MKTKILKILICSLVYMMCLNGCMQKEEEKEDSSYENEIFSYNLEDVSSFAVFGEELYVSYVGKNEIEKVGKNGEKKERYDFGDGEHKNLMYCDNNLISFTLNNNNFLLQEMNLDTKKLKSRTLPDIWKDYINIKSSAAAKENVYVIAQSEKYDSNQEAVRFDETDHYIYMGEKAICLNRKTLETRELPIDNVIFLYQISEEELIFYAYDDIGGYYFVTYEVNTEKFGEKQYNNQFDFINGFAVKEDKKTIVAAKSDRIIAADIDDEKIQTEFVQDVFIWYGNNLKCQGEDVYILDSNQDKNHVLRLDYQKVNHKNPEIHFYQTQIFEEPYGCGYKMCPTVLDEDEFALSVLAADTDYDICMMDSASYVSREIRDQGAFYPLNEVDHVMEYLDFCHLYIKEAAIKDNGEVWMLPISVDIPFILYGKACEENGIDMESVDNYEELINEAEKIYKNQNLQEWYDINGFQIQYDIFMQYHSKNTRKGEKADYQNNEFKEICNVLKEKSVWKNPVLHTFLISKTAVDKETYYDHFLFQLKTDKLGLDNDEFYHLYAKQTPKIEKGMSNKGSCIYFCVNQNSKNLESTLSYISDYCKYMMTRNDTYMFQDKETYPCPDSSLTKGLYEIYSQGEICFELPEEIFWDPYMDFMNDKIDFAEFAEEVERKVNMYNNE